MAPLRAGEGLTGAPNPFPAPHRQDAGGRGSHQRSSLCVVTRAPQENTNGLCQIPCQRGTLENHLLPTGCARTPGPSQPPTSHQCSEEAGPGRKGRAEGSVPEGPSPHPTLPGREGQPRPRQQLADHEEEAPTSRPCQDLRGEGGFLGLGGLYSRLLLSPYYIVWLTSSCAGNRPEVG